MHNALALAPLISCGRMGSTTRTKNGSRYGGSSARRPRSRPTIDAAKADQGQAGLDQDRAQTRRQLLLHTTRIQDLQLLHKTCVEKGQTYYSWPGLARGVALPGLGKE